MTIQNQIKMNECIRAGYNFCVFNEDDGTQSWYIVYNWMTKNKPADYASEVTRDKIRDKVKRYHSKEAAVITAWDFEYGN